MAFFKNSFTLFWKDLCFTLLLSLQLHTFQKKKKSHRMSFEHYLWYNKHYSLNTHKYKYFHNSSLHFLRIFKLICYISRLFQVYIDNMRHCITYIFISWKTWIHCSRNWSLLETTFYNFHKMLIIVFIIILYYPLEFRNVLQETCQWCKKFAFTVRSLVNAWSLTTTTTNCWRL